MDDLVEQACLYLTAKTYPEGCTATRKRQIRRKAEKFKMVESCITCQRESRYVVSLLRVSPPHRDVANAKTIVQLTCTTVLA